MSIFKIRILLLKLFIIVIPFYEVSVVLPQLRLPVFIFFIYMIIAIPTLQNHYAIKRIIKPTVILFTIYGLILVMSLINYVPGIQGGSSFLRQFPVFIFIYVFISNELILGKINMKQIMQLFILGTFLFVSFCNLPLTSYIHN